MPDDQPATAQPEEGENPSSQKGRDTDYHGIADALRADPDFNAVMDDIMRSVMDELSFMEGAVIRSDSTETLMQNIRLNGLTSIYDNLARRFPQDDRGELVQEAVFSTMNIAFDTGFRAGRLFHSRGHQIPL